MYKTFLIAVGVLSSVSASAEINVNENQRLDRVVELLDQRFSPTHVFSLSDVSCVVSELFPNIDRDQSDQLKVSVGIHYITR